MYFSVFFVTLIAMVVATPAPIPGTPVLAARCVETVTVNAFGTPPAGGFPTALPPGVTVIPGKRVSAHLVPCSTHISQRIILGPWFWWRWRLWWRLWRGCWRGCWRGLLHGNRREHSRIKY